MRPYTYAYTFVMFLNMLLMVLAILFARTIDKKVFGLKLFTHQWCITSCNKAACPGFPYDFIFLSGILFLQFYVRLLVSLYMLTWLVKMGDPDVVRINNNLHEMQSLQHHWRHADSGNNGGNQSSCFS